MKTNQVEYRVEMGQGSYRVVKVCLCPRSHPDRVIHAYPFTTDAEKKEAEWWAYEDLNSAIMALADGVGGRCE